MFPQKISQTSDILARIYENMFPWQPTPMNNKATFYLIEFQISDDYIYLFSKYEFLLYVPIRVRVFFSLVKDLLLLFMKLS